MHSTGVQSQGPGAPQEGRDALCTSQTHPWTGTAPITWPMRRSRRIYPRSYRPKPPETRKAQTDGARRRLKWRLRLRHLNEIKSIPQTGAPKSVTFSTKSAQPVKSKFSLRAHAARETLQWLNDGCCYAASKPVIQASGNRVGGRRIKSRTNHQFTGLSPFSQQRETVKKLRTAEVGVPN